MSDEFDLFGQLNNNVLAKIKYSSKAAAQETAVMNADLVDLDTYLNQTGPQQPSTVTAIKVKSKKSPPTKASKQKTKCQNEPEPAAPERWADTELEQSTQEAIKSPVVIPPPDLNRRKTRSATKAAAQESLNNSLNCVSTTAEIAAANKRAASKRRSRKQQTQTGTDTTGTQPKELPTQSQNTDDTVNLVNCVTIGDDFIDNARHRQSGRRLNRDVMRARRDYLAEKAARSTNVEYVDLITSPIIPITGTITIGSDEENEIPPTSVAGSNECNMDNSFDEENPQISVKINWQGQLETHKMRQYQKFLHIFNKLADREHTAIENLVLNLDNKIITTNDSPHSINYKIYQFITGRVLATKFDNPDLQLPLKKKKDINQITLKIQSDKWKQPFKVDMLKTDQCKLLYIKCAEELDIPINSIKLYFDGEFLEYNNTPNDLELDGGEVIDLRCNKFNS